MLYFVPFFFVFNPALVLQGEGPVLEVIYLFAQCVVGILFIAAGMEGYMLGVGKVSWWSRPLLVIGGTLIAYPYIWPTTVIGGTLVVLVTVILLIVKKMAPGKLQPAGP